MFVGTAGLEAIGTDMPGAMPSMLNRPSAAAADFAAILSLAEAWDVGAEIAPVSETSQTVSLAGHLRTTTTHFSDGSSETNVAVIGENPAPDPAWALQTLFQSPLPPRIIGPLSDLEPEVGIDRAQDDARPARWAALKSVKRSGQGQAPAGKTHSYAPEISDMAQALNAKEVGKLVDVMI